jgi:hypothetical protein
LPPGEKALHSSSRSDAGLPSAADQQKLFKNSIAELLPAVSEDLAPVRKRLETILNIQDPDFMRNALNNLRNDLHNMLLDMNKDPASAKPLEEAMTAALINGYSARARRAVPAGGAA